MAVTKKTPKMPPDVAPAAPRAPASKKGFIVEEWKTNHGEKIIVYGDTGIGKTSLALLAPDPVFIGTDEGGADFYHPVTGEVIKRVPDVETFADVRAALQQPSLFDAYKTVVLDTVTVLQDLAEDHVVATIPSDSGVKVGNIMGYGYNKGYKHLYNAMKSVLTDLDNLVRQGKNVILIAQAAIHNVPNPSGADFIRAGLNLHVDKSWSIEALYCQWADHIFRIDYFNSFIKDKKIVGDTTRAVFTQPEIHFRAKSRPLPVEVPGVVAFSTNADDTIWQCVFPEGGEA